MLNSPYGRVPYARKHLACLPDQSTRRIPANGATVAAHSSTNYKNSQLSSVHYDSVPNNIWMNECVCVVAPRAIGAELAAVDVVLQMAVDALRGDPRPAAARGRRVAGRAGEPGVGARQRKARLGVMVEAPDLPVGGGVALRAVGSQRAAVISATSSGSSGNAILSSPSGSSASRSFQ